MKQFPSEIWTNLEMSQPKGENLVARLIKPEQTENVIAAIAAIIYLILSFVQGKNSSDSTTK